jgi:threonine aldolase
VLVDTEDPAEAFLERCAEVGVLAVPFDDHQVRFCTHLDVSRADVEAVVERVSQVV